MANAPHPPLPQQETKKGLSPLAWIAIGCLGFLVLGGIVTALAGFFVLRKAGELVQQVEEDPVAAAAKLLAAGNPDVELVEADKENRTVTFRDLKTGQLLTVDYDDIEQGKLTFSADGKDAEVEFQTTGEEGAELTIRSDEGTAQFTAGADVGDLPEWVPRFPGAEATGNFASEAGGQRTGAFTFQTGSDLASILDFYEGEKDRAGLEVQSRTTSAEGAILILGNSDGSRGLTVIASRKGSSQEVAVTFTEKR